MRYREFAIEDTWTSRFADFQRQQTKKGKLRRKLRTASATAYQHHRQAADQRAKDHDKLADLRRQLAQPKL